MEKKAGWDIRVSEGDLKRIGKRDFADQDMAINIAHEAFISTSVTTGDITGS